MGDEEDFSSTVPFDRTVEQAILSIKKGAHLLKCGRRGKPKLCPFRLSTDEKYLIWYSGQEEKQLRLSSVTKVVAGQRTVNFQRQPQPDKEQQSFSLFYANGEQTLDLICKNKEQADSWYIGLRAVISRCHHSRPFNALRSCRGAQSCINSPAGFLRRKHNLGLVEDGHQLSQIHSLCGSPSLSLSERCFSDGLSYSSDSFYLSESNLSHMQNVMDVSIPNSPYIEPDSLKHCRLDYAGTESQKNASHRFVVSTYDSPRIEKNDILKDVMIWGEGVVGGNICGAVDRAGNHNGIKMDALLPKLLESTMMLDVQCISLGARHAALVTKQAEVFCWGDGNGGRLGHKVNMDVSYPKLVESLNGISVQTVACGEYQTCALTQSGELYAWGDDFNGAGLLGEVRHGNQWLPHKLPGLLDGVHVVSVACGVWHTAFVSASGQLFTYGNGSFGVLGHGSTHSLSQPKEVESLRGLRVKSVACGAWHTAAIVEIMADRRNRFNANVGKLFTWGDGDKGKLGHVDGDRKLLPTCVAQLVDFDFVQVSCGRMLTVALTNLGTVYAMGSAVHGQLGNPQAKDKSITIVEGKLKTEFVKQISSGSYHVAVFTSGGRVYTWGKGANGQLGLGDIEDRNSPTLVEALSDRHVETIACGSNLTAAICLHRSISVSDQSACTGCKMAFGFTRKKRNCYNCGHLFCRTCSSKKVVNASLAPNKSKPCRVCDPCFNHLQKITHSSRMLKLENPSPRLALQRAFSDEKEGRGEVIPKPGHQLSVKHSCNEETQAIERKTLRTQAENNQHLQSLSSLSAVLPRWGQVSCPALFEDYHSKNSMAIFPLSSPQSKSSILNSVDIEEDLSESNKMLNEEIQRLRAEVRSLEKKCQTGSQKIQECERKIEETWLLAKEEAAKCKAAKEVMKALAVRLHSMSHKSSAGREQKDGLDTNLPEVTPKCTASSAPEDIYPKIIASYLPPDVKLQKDRQVESLCGSPIVFSNTLKSMQGRDIFNDKDRSSEDSNATRAEPQRTGSKSSKHEWVEQYELGVYVTLTILASGQKGLKRVRFSRKRFTEKEAEQWWEKNQGTVYKKYGIEGYINSNQYQLKS